MKKISFASKPTIGNEGRGHLPSADQWVTGQTLTEPVKRLTIDVPLSLHRRIKTQCAIDDLVIADVVRDLLSKRFPELMHREKENGVNSES